MIKNIILREMLSTQHTGYIVLIPYIFFPLQHVDNPWTRRTLPIRVRTKRLKAKTLTSHLQLQATHTLKLNWILSTSHTRINFTLLKSNQTRTRQQDNKTTCKRILPYEPTLWRQAWESTNLHQWYMRIFFLCLWIWIQYIL